MKLINSLRYKRLSDTKSGELIEARLGGKNVLAMVLSVAPNRRISLALLRSEDGRELPCEVTFEANGRCTSLGTEFVLEVGPITDAAPVSRRHDPGAISIDEEGRTILTLAPFSRESHGDEVGFDLATLSFSSLPSEYCTVISSWKLWASESDRLRAGAVPIFEFRLPSLDNS